MCAGGATQDRQTRSDIRLMCTMVMVKGGATGAGGAGEACFSWTVFEPCVS